LEFPFGFLRLAVVSKREFASQNEKLQTKFEQLLPEPTVALLRSVGSFA
jgi:hypothetical protein